MVAQALAVARLLTLHLGQALQLQLGRIAKQLQHCLLHATRPSCRLWYWCWRGQSARVRPVSLRHRLRGRLQRRWVRRGLQGQGKPERRTM